LPRWRGGYRREDNHVERFFGDSLIGAGRREDNQI
jgi:hypothetical protein